MFNISNNNINSVCDLIGDTPIITINHDLIPEGKILKIKLEMFNPTFSVKDRTALGLIRKAFETGKLVKGGLVIESTSGNLGKSLAMLSASMNFRLMVIVDPKVSLNTINWFRSFGAVVDMVTIPDSSGGYQKSRLRRVQELLSEFPDAFWPNQYDNPDNPIYHEEVTAIEFLDLPIEMVAGTVSTGGHFCGISKGIKSKRPDIKCMACDVKGSAIFGQPFHPYLLNGLGLSWRSQNTDLSIFDCLSTVTDQEAISICRIMAKDLGLLLGGSSGVAIFAALKALHTTDIKSVLAIAPDTGINYLDQIYDDNWLSEKNVKLLSKLDIRNQFYTSSDNLCESSKVIN